MLAELDRKQTRAAIVRIPVAAAAGLLLSACQSLDQIAPLPSSLPGAHSTAVHSQLALGREIYVTKCARCHAPEPIHRYTAHKWEEIMADMAEETNLSDREAAAVRAYVVAVLSAPPQTKAASE